MRDSTRKAEKFFKARSKDLFPFSGKANQQILEDLFVFNHMMSFSRLDLKKPYFLTKKTLRHKIFDYLKTPFLGPLSSFDSLVSYIRLMEATFGAEVNINVNKDFLSMSAKVIPERASHKEAGDYWKSLEHIPEEFTYLYSIADYINAFFGAKNFISTNEIYFELPLFTKRNLFFAELLNLSLEVEDELSFFVVSQSPLSNRSIKLLNPYLSTNFITKGRFFNFTPLVFNKENSNLSNLFKLETGQDL